MTEFARQCADPDRPDFSQTCAEKVIASIGLDKAAIDECIKSEVESKDLGLINLAPTRVVEDTKKIRSNRITMCLLSL